MDRASTLLDDHIKFDDLFEGEPDEFDPEPNPLARTLEEELADLYGGNAPIFAFDDYTQLKERSEDNNVEISATVTGCQINEHGVPIKREPEALNVNESQATDIPGQRLDLKPYVQHEETKALGDLIPTLNNSTYSNRVARLAPEHSAASLRGQESSRNRFEDLLERADTPSELELEQIDLHVHEVMKQIALINARHDLQKTNPTFTKQKLFRIYRHAMKLIQDFDDEDEHQAEDTKRVGMNRGGSNECVSLDFADSDSWENASRVTSKENSTIKSEKNRRNISKSSSNRPMNRSSSSLLEAKPYLHDLTPTDVEGHYPTTIARSPRTGKSRTSSLTSETRFERKATPVDVATSVGDSVHCGIATPGYVEAPAQSRLLPAPLFHSAHRANTSSGGSSPSRVPAPSPSASIHAVAGSPAPDPASIARSEFSIEHHESDDLSMQDLTPYTSSEASSTRRHFVALSANHRSPDPFAAGADVISFSPSAYSPPLSPLHNPASQIQQPKRQDRRKLDAKDSGKAKAKKPAGRTVSARSPSKAQVSARKNVNAKRCSSLRVQGHNVKISKNKAPNRKPSSRVTRSKRIPYDETEEVPRVPSLLQDMDVDLPLPELRVSFPADEAAPLEAEGGKQFNESQHSPSNRKTKTRPKNSRPRSQQATAMRQTNDGGHEQTGLTPIIHSSSSIPASSPPPRKPGTGGSAVRGTHSSAHRNGADEYLEESEIVVSPVQISSPKAKPQPAKRDLTPTPVKQGKHDVTPGSAGTQMTSNTDVSPKTPARVRKTKPKPKSKIKPAANKDADDSVDVSPKTPAQPPDIKAASGKAGGTNSANLDQDKLTPTSVGKKGNDRNTTSTPTRRSPRIASVK